MLQLRNESSILKVVLSFKVCQFVSQGCIKCAIQRAGLIDSEDPKHLLFYRETAFVVIYALFSGLIFPSFDGNSNIFATFIEQKSYG